MREAREAFVLVRALFKDAAASGLQPPPEEYVFLFGQTLASFSFSFRDFLEEDRRIQKPQIDQAIRTLVRLLPEAIKTPLQITGRDAVVDLLRAAERAAAETPFGKEARSAPWHDLPMNLAFFAIRGWQESNPGRAIGLGENGPLVRLLAAALHWAAVGLGDESEAAISSALRNLDLIAWAKSHPDSAPSANRGSRESSGPQPPEQK